MRKRTFKKLWRWENNSKSNIKEHQKIKFNHELDSFKEAILEEINKEKMND